MPIPAKHARFRTVHPSLRATVLFQKCWVRSAQPSLRPFSQLDKPAVAQGASERFVIDLVSQARLAGVVEFLGLKSPLGKLALRDPELRQQLRLVGELQGKPFGSFAYCFCSVR